MTTLGIVLTCYWIR